MKGPGVQDTTDLLNAIARGAEALSRGAGWPDGTDTLLSEIGAVTGADRVWLCQIVERENEFVIYDSIGEWVEHPEYSVQGDLSMFHTCSSEAEYGAIHQDHMAGRHHTAVTSDLPECALKALLHRRNVRSMLTVPILINGILWGALGVDQCKRESPWLESEVALLRSAGALLVNSIQRTRLHARQKQFEILKRFTDCFAWELDLQRMMLWISGDLSRIPGNGKMHLSLRKALGLIHPDDRRHLHTAINEHIASGQSSFRHDVRLLHPDGESNWAEIIGSLERNEQGEPHQFAGIMVDIRQRKHQEMKLKEQAHTDPLTGAANRRTFERNLSFQMERAARDGMELSLLAIDFDRFKEINDTWGHQVGDMVLKKFVCICEECLRSGDVLARIGGEEFMVILPGAGEKAAIRVGERIRESVEDLSLLLEAGSIAFTISIGCVTWYQEIHSPDSFLEMADKALFEAKRAGRNRLVCHRSESAEA